MCLSEANSPPREEGCLGATENVAKPPKPRADEVVAHEQLYV
jgi:hypothetical protein